MLSHPRNAAEGVGIPCKPHLESVMAGLSSCLSAVGVGEEGRIRSWVLWARYRFLWDSQTPRFRLAVEKDPCFHCLQSFGLVYLKHHFTGVVCVCMCLRTRPYVCIYIYKHAYVHIQFSFLN